MAKVTLISFKEFRTKFATEDCRDYLFEERFPESFVLPQMRRAGVLLPQEAPLMPV